MKPQSLNLMKNVNSIAYICSQEEWGSQYIIDQNTRLADLGNIIAIVKIKKLKARD